MYLLETPTSPKKIRQALHCPPIVILLEGREPGQLGARKSQALSGPVLANGVELNSALT